MPRQNTSRYGRYYEIEGEPNPLPSVTTILSCIAKPALITWAANRERELTIETSANLWEDMRQNAVDRAGSLQEPFSRTAWVTAMGMRLGRTKANQKELEKAAEVGSQTHKMIEWTLRAELLQDAGPTPTIGDKALYAFNEWQSWRKGVNLKPIFVEFPVWSHTYGYAGTADLLCEMDGHLCLCDWKTGKDIYGEAHLQNAAYREALNEMGHGPVECGFIGRFPKVETDPPFQVVAAKDGLFPVFLHTMELWKWQEAENQAYRDKRDAEKPA